MYQNFPKDLCLVCGFLHPPSWDCPEMASEILLRLALDKLRRTLFMDPNDLVVKINFLTQKLVRLQEKKQTQPNGG